MILNENILRKFLEDPSWSNENTINLFHRLYDEYIDEIKILKKYNKELYEDNKILVSKIILPIKKI